MDTNKHYSQLTGLEARVTLTPLETRALATLNSALDVLTTYYRVNNHRIRSKDAIDSFDGYRQEFEDALAVIQELGATLHERKEAT